MRSASIGGMSNAPEVLHIACLCAAWCRLCDAYGEVLHAARAETVVPGAVLHWHWIDIEDEAELLGDFDVETFPTLVIVDPREVRVGARGDLELLDMETGLLRQVTLSPSQCEAYARAHAEYCEHLAAFCAGRGIGYFRADTSVPFEDLVLHIFRSGGFLR